MKQKCSPHLLITALGRYEHVHLLRLADVLQRLFGCTRILLQYFLLFLAHHDPHDLLLHLLDAVPLHYLPDRGIVARVLSNCATDADILNMSLDDIQMIQSNQRRAEEGQKRAKLRLKLRELEAKKQQEEAAELERIRQEEFKHRRTKKVASALVSEGILTEPPQLVVSSQDSESQVLKEWDKLLHQRAESARRSRTPSKKEEDFRPDMKQVRSTYNDVLRQSAESFKKRPVSATRDNRPFYAGSPSVVIPSMTSSSTPIETPVKPRLPPEAKIRPSSSSSRRSKPLQLREEPVVVSTPKSLPPEARMGIKKPKPSLIEQIIGDESPQTPARTLTVDDPAKGFWSLGRSMEDKVLSLLRSWRKRRKKSPKADELLDSLRSSQNRLSSYLATSPGFSLVDHVTKSVSIRQGYANERNNLENFEIFDLSESETD
ncbi:hypothetical protein GEMRC1_002386 [Eukaryota sp. GEM-RC1]